MVTFVTDVNDDDDDDDVEHDDDDDDTACKFETNPISNPTDLITIHCDTLTSITTY